MYVGNLLSLSCVYELVNICFILNMTSVNVYMLNDIILA